MKRKIVLEKKLLLGKRANVEADLETDGHNEPTFGPVDKVLTGRQARVPLVPDAMLRSEDAGMSTLDNSADLKRKRKAEFNCPVAKAVKRTISGRTVK